MTALRLAFRSVRRQPGAPAIVVPIALAIAVNSALFAVVDGLLFRPLPFLRPAELVAIDYRKVDGQVPALQYLPTLAGEREAIRLGLEQSSLVIGRANAGFASFFDPGLSQDAGLEITGIDPRFFRLLGVTPERGRDFADDDRLNPAVTAARDSPEPLPIIVGQALWQRQFGGDPELPAVRTLAGRSVRIVGVMPAGVKFPGETNVWAPLSPIKAGGRPPAYARLARGATVEQLASQFPQLDIRSLADAIRPRHAESLLVLFGAAALLLLAAWLQIAALVASTTVSRIKEIGVRLALGAGRGRLAWQFGLENALLAIAAFACAWAIVGPLTLLIVRMLPGDLSRGQYVMPDLRTLAFGAVSTTFGLGLLTLLPFRIVRRASPVRLLTGHLGDLPLSAERTRHGLLIGQVALTTMLLYLAGLTMHSFQRARAFDYGFDAANVLLVTPPIPKTYDPADVRPGDPDGIFEAQYQEKMRRTVATVEALRTVPGVIAAAHFFDLPLMSKRPTDEQITSFGGAPLVNGVPARPNVASGDFLKALGATLVAGRGFDDPEYADRDDIVIVNEALADNLMPPLTILGSTVRVNVLDKEISTRQRFRGRIIGIIKNLADSPAMPAEPAYFYPARHGQAAAVIAVRATPSVDAALPAIRATLDRVWDGVPPRNLALMSDNFQRMLLPYRGQAILVSVIAGFCVPLAAMGLAGALLYSVRARTREIAIRLAIGADPAVVRRAVVRRALTVVSGGLTSGLFAGFLIGRAIQHQFLEIHPADPWTMGVVILMLLMLAWSAALVPARQASRTDPAAILRQG